MDPVIPTLLIGIVGDSVAGVNLRALLSFPDPVNETSARLVAAGVVAQAIAVPRRSRVVGARAAHLRASSHAWLPVRRSRRSDSSSPGSPPRRSSDGCATRRPGFESRQVPGRPKRFAQSIGLAFTASASLAWVLGAPGVALVLIGLLAAAATLEAGLRNLPRLHRLQRDLGLRRLQRHQRPAAPSARRGSRGSTGCHGRGAIHARVRGRPGHALRRGTSGASVRMRRIPTHTPQP